MVEQRSDLMMRLLAGGEQFMVESHFVQEVISFERVYRVPGTPPYLAGLANFRGTVLPLAKLSVLLGLLAGPSRMGLVISLAGLQLGLLVEDVLDVIPSYKIVHEEKAKLPEEVKPEFIKGVVRVSGELLFLLDLPAIIGEVFPGSLASKGA